MGVALLNHWARSGVWKVKKSVDIRAWNGHSLGVESGGWSRLMESKITQVFVKERRELPVVLRSLEDENIRTRCEI